MMNDKNNENVTGNPCMERMETFHEEERVPFEPVVEEDRRGVKIYDYRREKGATRTKHKMESLTEWKKFQKRYRYISDVHPGVERGLARMARSVESGDKLCKDLKLAAQPYPQGRLQHVMKKIEHYERVRDDFLVRLSHCIRLKKEFCRNMSLIRERLISYCRNVDGYTDKEDNKEFATLCSKLEDFDSEYNSYGEPFEILFEAAQKVVNAIAGIRRRDVVKTAKKPQNSLGSKRVHKKTRKPYKFHHYR